MPLTIGIVAGECSGDRLGASLITALRALVPDVRFVGVAGPDMRAVGCESWFDMEALSVMGLVEVLRHLPRLLNMRRALVRRFTALQPDIFIGIDAPDFNLSLELALKRRGIRTLHYVSPSVWAWRPQRIVKIAQATDLVLALFPFEQAFYDAHGVPCRFVGHTLADEMPLEPDRAEARRRLGIAAQAHCLALLPGSRQAEIAQLTPPFLQAAQLLRQGYPELVIVVPLVNSARRAQFIRLHNRYAPALPLVLLDQQATVAMQAADATLLASGTATLECLLAKCPMVVGYKLNPITFWLAKRLVKTLYIALPNLLADRPLVVELLQTACAPQPLAEALMPLLNGDNVHLKHCFTALHQQMRCQASQRAAQAVLELVQGCC